MHSGINGGQPQGSYRVAMFKDGVELPMSKCAPSIALAKSSGPLGDYNFKCVLNLSELPGNSVAGNYRLYVLDGNGNRDSRDVTFGVPTDQGQVWIVFDQA